MIKALHQRFQQGHQTIAVAGDALQIPEWFRGRPVIDQARCMSGCTQCEKACPTEAIIVREGEVSVDLGRCLFCDDCQRACPEGAITHARDHRMATRDRTDLVVTRELALAQALDRQSRRLFGRSLKLRQVCAGGCNACESELNVLSSVLYDLARFGVEFVASPRHADGLVITGPVTRNMLEALRTTYDAIPSPKIVVAVGACAISGGPFAGNPEQNDGADSILPIDLYIPGCPPHPFTILDGILRLLGQIDPDENSTSTLQNHLD